LAFGFLTISYKVLTASPNLSVPSGGWELVCTGTKEGDQLRRFYELKLDRSDHPIFVLSCMLFHVIDKDSPLHGLKASDLSEADTLLVLNVGGVDDSSAQQLDTRHAYSWRDTTDWHRLFPQSQYDKSRLCC